MGRDGPMAWMGRQSYVLPRLQAERNLFLAFPCRPLASASFEHSMLLALMVGLPAGAVAAGGFGAGAAGVVWATANEAKRPSTAAAVSVVNGLNIEISLWCWMRGPKKAQNHP